MPTYVIGIAVFMVVYFIGLAIYFNVRKKKTSGKADEFLQQYPNAAKVYLTEKKNAGVAHVKVSSVNGEKPVEFPELSRPGFYLQPGQNSCEMKYEYSEVRGKRKTVIHSTGTVTKILEVEAGKSYLLSYNDDENQFEFKVYTV